MRLTQYTTHAVLLTPNQTQHTAWQLSRRIGVNPTDLSDSTLVDAQGDLNFQQIDVAPSALLIPLSRGVMLADAVDLSKTIEPGLEKVERWGERKLRVLVAVLVNWRKQRHLELQDGFRLYAQTLEAGSARMLGCDGIKRIAVAHTERQDVFTIKWP